MISIIGYIAAVCTTASFIPQAVKVYKTRTTRDISLGMISLMTFGVFAWLVYGIMISAMPIIAANLITLLLSVYIFIMKIKLG
jgi:MtN3 and saliva related transmembrane protein